VALLAGALLRQSMFALLIGVGAAVVHMIAFFYYQRWRFRLFELEESTEESK